MFIDWHNVFSVSQNKIQFCEAGWQTHNKNGPVINSSYEKTKYQYANMMQAIALSLTNQHADTTGR